MKKINYNNLEVIYIPYECVAVNFPHYELAEKVGKKYTNVFCFYCGEQGNSGVKLLRKILAEIRRTKKEGKS